MRVVFRWATLTRHPRRERGRQGPQQATAANESTTTPGYLQINDPFQPQSQRRTGSVGTSIRAGRVQELEAHERNLSHLQLPFPARSQAPECKPKCNVEQQSTVTREAQAGRREAQQTA